MKVKVKAGTQGWFNVKFQGADVATFAYDTEVEVEEFTNAPAWFRTKGHVPGFPFDHPAILLYKTEVGPVALVQKETSDGG